MADKEQTIAESVASKGINLTPNEAIHIAQNAHEPPKEYKNDTELSRFDVKDNTAGAANLPTMPYFLSNFLSKPVGSIPRVPIWSITFDSIPLDTIIRVNDYEENFIQQLDDNTLKTLCGDVLHTSKGCLYAQGVQLPGDGFTSNAEGQQQGGLYREYMNQGRDDLSKIKVSFIDTSVSFVEHVVRPWVLMVSWLGMIKRSLEYRTNINVMRWGLGMNGGNTPVIYQQWTFYGACPVSVSNEDIDYTVQSGFIRRDVSFVFQKYSYYPGPRQFKGDLFKQNTLQ